MNRETAVPLLYRLAIVLLSFLCLFILWKLSPVWKPLLTVFSSVLLPFFIAAFIAYLLHPFIERIHGLGVPRSLAVLFIYLLFFGGIGWAVYNGFPVILRQLRELAEKLPDLINVYREWIRLFYESTADLPEGVHDRFEQLLAAIEENISSTIEGVLLSLRSIVNNLILIALIPFIAFYFLKDYKKINRAAWYITPRRWRPPLIKFLRDADKTLGNYIRGQLLVCLFIGVFAFAGLWAAGMPYPLLLAFIIGITNIIPYFGPVIGALPAVIIALTISVKMVIIVIVIIFILQMLEGNLLSPLIVGKTLHIHPAAIMFALLLGEQIAGITGLILAVPAFAVLKTAVLHVHGHFAAKRRNENGMT
ncbi:AI-2E family transporter [Bacillus marinisedimentorum]|uniref:AI-2E family transporter n=1 Tax=Bacillus marinisedimentorum TaxID=1821260 RepID=UPI0007E14168|nr:AI-2E family transporter [Bacillus marinisedimentorum]